MAEEVLADPGDTVHLSISDLAGRAATSEATVVRLCQRAGFAGYPELRLALATAVGRSSAKGSPSRLIGTDVGPDDPLPDLVAKVGAADDPGHQRHDRGAGSGRAGSRGGRHIARAPHRDYGIGASGLVALDLEHKLRRIGLSAAASTDGHLALTSAAVLSPDDVAVGISHGGETLDILDPLRKLGHVAAPRSGSPTTPVPPLRPPLVLTVAAHESLFRAGAMASRTAQLAVVDCIYLAVAQRRYEGAVTALDDTSAALRSRHQGYP